MVPPTASNASTVEAWLGLSTMGARSRPADRESCVDRDRAHPDAACYHRRAMEIMGIRIDTIVEDNVATPLRRLPRDHRGHALADQPPGHRGGRDAGRRGPSGRRSTRARSSSTPTGARPALDGRRSGYLFCRKGRGPRDHAADPDPRRRRTSGGACATASTATTTSSSRPDPRRSAADRDGAFDGLSAASLSSARSPVRPCPDLPTFHSPIPAPFVPRGPMSPTAQAPTSNASTGCRWVRRAGSSASTPARSVDGPTTADPRLHDAGGHRRFDRAGASPRLPRHGARRGRPALADSMGATPERLPVSTAASYSADLGRRGVRDAVADADREPTARTAAARGRAGRPPRRRSPTPAAPTAEAEADGAGGRPGPRGSRPPDEPDRVRRPVRRGPAPVPDRTGRVRPSPRAGRGRLAALYEDASACSTGCCSG